MMQFTEELNAELAKNRVSSDSFRRALSRLLAEGCLKREESSVTLRLFDDLSRVKEIAQEYLSVLGITLVHEEDLELFRLIAPQADAEGKPTDEGLAKRPGANLSSFLVALWMEYEEAYRAGELNDKANAITTLSKLNLTMASRLERPLPELMGELRGILKEACALNLISCNLEGNPKSDDFVIEISSLITRVLRAEDLIEAIHEECKAGNPAETSQVEASEESFKEDLDHLLMASGDLN